MCGIAGILSLGRRSIPRLSARLEVMNSIQSHRGPDGQGSWSHPAGHVGFGHRRLSIIDLNTGHQPMSDHRGNWITYNGEIYNFIELRNQLGKEQFRTTSDTEVVLAAYSKWGSNCVDHFRGMFAFALWDESRQVLFCARDRIGIKPFYYAENSSHFYFASEAKAILPFLPDIKTDHEGLKDYLTFQFCLDGKTLFEGIRELPAGHVMEVQGGKLNVRRYWDFRCEPDFDHTPRYFEENVRRLLTESVSLHLRSDVPVGAYISGGIDSSTVALLAAKERPDELLGFTGRFPFGDAFDESRYAREVAEARNIGLHELEITPDDFIRTIEKVVFHLDYPIAGPGSFAQFMISGLAAQHRKVLLGGQGGDELFGGYVRYLIAYFEQCIKAAIDGTMKDGNFIVTYETILPNLQALRGYKPMLQEFWKEGLFDDLEHRYFRLINRAPELGDEINWPLLGDYSPFDTFRRIFKPEGPRHFSYLDRMIDFDLRTLLPALLQVEDRVSMAHGLESRVPFLDHPLIELATSIPSNIKFMGGDLKHVLKVSVKEVLPESIRGRTDKMGFPVPLQLWLAGHSGVQTFIKDLLSSRNAQTRALINNKKVLAALKKEPKFGRKIWGFICLELWQRIFHDRAAEYKNRLKEEALA